MWKEILSYTVVFGTCAAFLGTTIYCVKRSKEMEKEMETIQQETIQRIREAKERIMKSQKKEA